MLERMWSKRNTHLLLVEVQTCTDTLEVRVVVSQKPGNEPTTRPSYTTPGHIPKRCSVIPQGHLINYIHSNLICISQNLEKKLDVPQPRNG